MRTLTPTCAPRGACAMRCSAASPATARAVCLAPASATVWSWRNSPSRAATRRAAPPLRATTLDTAPAAAASAPAAPPGFFLDEDALLSASTFPIAPAELIAKCKACLLANFGASNPALLAPDFKFVAPVVGPLGKKEFVDAFNSFDVLVAFPDMRFQYHHFRVDPLEPSRVWYTARAVGTHTGSFAGAIAPTGRRVESPPQSCSMRFNAAGECEQLTVGYVMDRQLGNTGGLGAVFGLLYGIGYPLPFPEAQPWTPSWQYQAFQTGSGFVQKLLGAISPRKQ